MRSHVSFAASSQLEFSSPTRTGKGFDKRLGLFRKVFTLLLILGSFSQSSKGGERKFSISGTIAGASATVTLSGHAAASAQPDAAGHYRFSGLEKGRYVVLINRDGYVFTPEAVAVDITNSDVEGVDAGATSKNDMSHSVKLKWDPSPTQNIKGYRLFRSKTSGGPYQPVEGAQLISDTSFVDTSVNAGQNYFYVTRSVNAEGLEGPASNEIVVKVPSR